MKLKLQITSIGFLLAAFAAPAAQTRLAIGFAEYSLASNRLEVADIADPAAPLPVCHFDLDGLEPSALSVADGVLLVEGAAGTAEFDLSDIFAPEPVLIPGPPLSIPLVAADNGLLLAASGWDGVRVFREGPDGAPEQVTRCVTEGPALAVAAIPGGFAVALGTRGYALFDLDEAGLVTLRRQWPLETGRAVSAAYDATGKTIAFDCQEGGIRKVGP